MESPVTIVLPRVVGTRPAVAGFLTHVPRDLTDREVELDCRGLLSGTASFADELVKILLKDSGARRLVARGPGADFAADLRVAADDHGVADRLSVEGVPATAGTS
jgi:hypothetical protein